LDGETCAGGSDEELHAKGKNNKKHKRVDSGIVLSTAKSLTSE